MGQELFFRGISPIGNNIIINLKNVTSIIPAEEGGKAFIRFFYDKENVDFLSFESKQQRDEVFEGIWMTLRNANYEVT